MKAIMIMYDTLVRRLLPPYGCDSTIAPNFSRLQQRSLTFDNFYAGSLPCMPARRELHTGRYNFLHRSWGPIEPFDESMPEILKNNGVYTHLVTDHDHYFEDGGATYHNRYSSFEFFRGQEGDKWKALLKPLDMPKLRETGRPLEHYRVNFTDRMFQKTEKEMSAYRTFTAGAEFIDENHDADNWFLQIESFDPHEPFYVMEEYIKMYAEQLGIRDDYTGDFYDWPVYGRVTDEQEAVAHIRLLYKALVTMCDRSLGRILDLMDKYHMWEDTMLIVNTDHGFLLGEHENWGKNIQPMYDELVHIPFFIWDPRYGKCGQRRQALCQTIDLAPTLLDYFGMDIPENMQGKSLRPIIDGDEQLHEGVLFGIHGGHVNVTDGRFVYMKASVSEDNQPLCEYTLMPTHMIGLFKDTEFQGATLCNDFKFIGNYPVMKLPGWTWLSSSKYGDMLFDLDNDPGQERNLLYPGQEHYPLTEASGDGVSEIGERMRCMMRRLMAESEAPAEQYERIGLSQK